MTDVLCCFRHVLEVNEARLVLCIGLDLGACKNEGLEKVA